MEIGGLDRWVPFSRTPTRTHYKVFADLLNNGQHELIFIIYDAYQIVPMGPRLHSGVDVALQPKHVWPWFSELPEVPSSVFWYIKSVKNE